MKPEEQIDQKQLLKLIKLLNETFKTKIKTKGSIPDLAEAFATGVDAISNRPDASIPGEVIDFYNDLFQDEAAGYKPVDVDSKATAPAEEPPEEIETTPLEELEPEPPPEDDGIEQLAELEPEQELPGEDETPPPAEPLDELEELDETPEPTTKRTQKQTNPKKEGISMLEQLKAITSKPDLKAFVAANSINVKLKNSESLQVWKAKVKKLVEGICKLAETKPEPATANPGPKAGKKPAKKPEKKPKAAPKAEKKVATKPKAEKAARKPRGDKDPFGVVIGSLTHKFVQTIFKKPHTMRQLIDANIGKHPKAFKKFQAMGYMERDKSGFISMTAKGRNVYGGGK